MYVRKSGNKEAEEKQRENIKSTLEKIEQFFKEAQAYYKSNPEERNVRFEAMKGLFDGSKKLFVHTDYIKSMEAAVLFSKQFNMNMVLVGGADSWMMASFLKQNNIPVILGRSHSLPPREDDDTDLPYKLPSLLQQAGVKFVIGNDGSWQTRNLAFQAGTAAAFGLSKEEALRAITLSAAEVLGIDQTTGSLSVGKDASLIVSAGDMLDMRSNAVEQAYINGRPVNLDDVQKQLYRKYMNKYGLK